MRWSGCRTLATMLAAALLAATAPAHGGTAVEYYYADWNYYFVTAFPDEIAVLDGGAFGGVWKRTGQTFEVFDAGAPGVLPTCRFFSTAFAPRSSHFYTPFAAECDTVKANAAWQYESIAFHLALPGADGNCATGTVPLYRLYNDGMGGAPNHRYTTDRATFTQMQALGWTFEGDGRTGTFACVPPSPPGGAKGLWHAQVDGGRNVTIVVLEDGQYYIAYSNAAGSSIDGGLQGQSTAANGVFTSTSSRNVALRTVLADGSRSVTGTYAPQASLHLVVGTGATAVTLDATYDAAWQIPGNVAQLAGSYRGVSGHALDSFSSTMTIDATGRIHVVGGCDHNGTITPHGSTGVFDLIFTNGCLPAGSPKQTGIVVYDAATGSFFAMSPLFADDMVFFAGTRQ